MNTVVWKFPLMLVPEQAINVPVGAVALAVQMQDDVPTLWATVDPNAPPLPRRILMVGTGHHAPELGYALYLGTVQMDSFVWHYFETLPADLRSRMAT